MQLSVHFENTAGGPVKSGPVQVGWFLNQSKGSIIYFPPERVRSADMNKNHAKSASRCPAVINLESRYFMIRCPFDLNLGFTRDKDGKPGLRNLSGEKSPIRGNKLRDVIHLTPEQEWRYDGVPTIQLKLPYVFIADEPVYISQVAPFMDFQKTPFPGTIFGGRFPINVWPRPLMWAITGQGVDRLLAHVSSQLKGQTRTETLTLPWAQGAAHSWLQREGVVEAERQTDEGWSLDVRWTAHQQAKFEKAHPQAF